MRKFCSKVIVENFFEPCLLYLLSEKESYGYEIKQNLDKRYCCKVNIGNLYRCLNRLNKQGAVTKKKISSLKGPDKVSYAVTTTGKKLLKEWVEELEGEVKTIKQLITNYKKLYEANK